MEKDAMFDAITAHRLALATQLGGLSPEQWDVPSLCAGWRVRDVLGHLVSILDLPRRRFLLGVFSLAGFNRRVDQIAKEYGARQPADLLDIYVTNASRRFAPPVLGAIAPLSDVVLHSLDIQHPLGLDSVHADEPARAVLSALSGGIPGFTPRSLTRGLRFEATDSHWSTGDGALVRGGTAALLMAMSNRRAGLDGLDGPGVAMLRERMAG
jgi:uncharacterized protein (TIGR03083 family)